MQKIPPTETGNRRSFTLRLPYHSYQHVLCRASLLEIRFVDMFFCGHFPLRKQIFYQCLETTQTRNCQYGHPGRYQYGNSLFIQCFQSFFPGFWLDKGITPHLYFEAASVIIAFILLGRLLKNGPDRVLRQPSKN